jgi:hypothetical protein
MDGERAVMNYYTLLARKLRGFLAACEVLSSGMVQGKTADAKSDFKSALQELRNGNVTAAVSAGLTGRTVAAGELLPRAAVGLVSGIQYSAVVLVPRGELSASIGAGSTVDVWSARELEAGVFGAPVVLIPEALVVRIVESEGIVVGDSAGSVEVLVPRARIARLLEAIANDDAISLVPASLPAGE